jgi:hypothetical protein
MRARCGGWSCGTAGAGKGSVLADSPTLPAGLQVRHLILKSRDRIRFGPLAAVTAVTLCGRAPDPEEWSELCALHDRTGLEKLELIELPAGDRPSERWAGGPEVVIRQPGHSGTLGTPIR